MQPRIFSRGSLHVSDLSSTVQFFVQPSRSAPRAAHPLRAFASLESSVIFRQPTNVLHGYQIWHGDIAFVFKVTTALYGYLCTSADKLLAQAPRRNLERLETKSLFPCVSIYGGETIDKDAGRRPTPLQYFALASLVRASLHHVEFATDARCVRR